MPTIYGPLDLVRNELRNAAVQNLGTAPSSPVKGQLYFDTIANVLYWWDGSQWIAAKAAPGATPAATVTTQAVGDAPVVGTSTNFAREDHKHGREAFGAITTEQTFGVAGANGSAATVARSDHTHGNPVHDAAAHSAIPLSALAPPTANLNLNTFKIINLVDPTANQDAATKLYVDNLINGLSWKDTARAATTANIALSGAQTIDGVTLVPSDRVLVKNQTTASQNGIYVVAAGAWSRTADADSQGDLLNASVYVSEGTVNKDTAWTCTTDAPITVDTTSLAWAQFTGPGTYTAGNGLTLTANQFAVGAGTGILSTAGQVAVDTTVMATKSYVDTGIGATALITAGNGLTKTGQTVDVVGGTGITVAADLVSVDTTVIATKSYVDTGIGATAITTAGSGLSKSGQTLNAVAGTGILVGANIAVDTSVIATQAYVTTAITNMARKVAALLSGSASPEVITHNLNTRDVQVTVLNGASPYTAVEVDWDATTLNTVTIRYNPALGAGYRAVVVG